MLTVVNEVADRMIGPVGRTEAELAAAVARVSEAYNRDRAAIAEASTDAEGLAARLRFFLPRDVPKIGGPLAELAAADALPPGPRWRVLDLGAGLGTTSLGVARFAARTGAAEALDVVAVDRDERALRIFGAIAERAEEAGLASISLDRRDDDLQALDPGALGAPFDLVVAGLTLNELGVAETAEAADAQAAMLARWAGVLAPHGSLVVLEPALRVTTRALQWVRDHVVERGELGVFAPCLRGGACPMLAQTRNWCHDELDVSLPEPLVPVARQAGLRYERLTYSYLTLRRDDRNLREAIAGEDGEPYRIVSSPRPTKGKLELTGCGRPGLPVLMRLDRHRSDDNAALEEAHRGDLVAIDPGEPSGSGERLRIRPETRVRHCGM